MLTTDQQVALHEQWARELGISHMTANEQVLHIRRMEAEGTPVISLSDYIANAEHDQEMREFKQNLAQIKDDSKFIANSWWEDLKLWLGR